MVTTVFLVASLGPALKKPHKFAWQRMLSTREFVWAYMGPHTDAKMTLIKISLGGIAAPITPPDA